MAENLDYETLNTVVNAVSEFYKYNATLETAQKTLYAACFTAIASIVVAFITILGNYKINIKSKKVDYQNDYYKKIIDKRITAYEELEKFLAEIDVETDAYIYDKNGERITIHYYTFCEKRMDFQDSAHKSIKICRYNTWYSKNMESLVNLLNLYIVNSFSQTTHPINFTNGMKVFSKENNLDLYDIILPNGFVISSENNPQYPVYISKSNIIYAKDLFSYVRIHDVVNGSLWFNEFFKLISEIRKTIITDMLELHEVEKFLNDKK